MDDNEIDQIMKAEIPEVDPLGTDPKDALSPNTIGEGQQAIASFVMKLHQMLNDPTNEKSVGWKQITTDNGELQWGLAIKDRQLFMSDTMPRYFKGSQICSFIRQLNAYNFQHIGTAKGSVIPVFIHEYFQKDKPELMARIQRRKPEKRRSSASTISSDHSTVSGATASNNSAKTARRSKPNSEPQEETSSFSRPSLPAVTPSPPAPVETPDNNEELQTLRNEKRELERQNIELRKRLDKLKSGYHQASNSVNAIYRNFPATSPIILAFVNTQETLFGVSPQPSANLAQRLGSLVLSAYSDGAGDVLHCGVPDSPAPSISSAGTGDFDSRAHTPLNSYVDHTTVSALQTAAAAAAAVASARLASQLQGDGFHPDNTLLHQSRLQLHNQSLNLQKQLQSFNQYNNNGFGNGNLHTMSHDPIAFNPSNPAFQGDDFPADDYDLSAFDLENLLVRDDGPSTDFTVSGDPISH